MKRSRLTEWDTGEIMDSDDHILYEQIEVNQLLDEGPRLLDSYYMANELHGKDSKLAKEALEELFEYVEDLRG